MPPCTSVDERTLQRIRGEFLEMPGMRLTCEQAQRLWALDAETCRTALDMLVTAKFLWRAAQGSYARLAEGAHLTARAPMARAGASRAVRPVQANAS